MRQIRLMRFQKGFAKKPISKSEEKRVAASDEDKKRKEEEAEAKAKAEKKSSK